MEKKHFNKILLSWLAWLAGSLFFGAIAGITGIYLYLSPNLPDIESLKVVELQTPLRVYSIDDKLIGEFGEKRRDPISIDQAPQALVDAILSAEDDGFYGHSGVDLKGLARATTQLLLSGEIQTGGSTITMQVARNFFLSREQTFSRKFNEILLALKIEQALSKPEILELYLNKIYLGNRAYGVKAAAQAYYGKPLRELSLAQMAMIAGLPKAPSTFNPIANPSRALVRRDWILKRMLTLGKIPNEAYEEAISEPVTARYYGQKLDLNAPYIAEAAREKAIELFGETAYTEGYKVYTTVDSRLQASAQESIVEGLLAYDLRHGYRGPEQQLDPSLLEALIPEEEQEATTKPSVDTANETVNIVEQLGPVNLIPWVEILKKTPSYGILEPAIVIRVGETFISAITAFGTTVDIPWENGLDTARNYVNENFAEKPPKSPAEVAMLGDMIRIYQKDEQWHFSQVPNIQAALVSLSPDDGAVRSLVGGFDFNQSKFNRVVQAKRQPGSNFKPFIYSIGLENEMTAASIFNDAPIVVEDKRLESVWRPENSSGKFYGPTRLRTALYLSRNLVSIRLLRAIGVGNTIKSLERFGMDTSAIPKDLSMALGSYVMTPMEVATGYSVFASGGYRTTPYLIHHIRDRYNNVLYTAKPDVTPNRQALAFDPNKQNPQNTLPPNDLDELEDNNITQTDEPNIDQEESSLEEANSTELSSVILEGKPAKRVMDERVAYIMNSMLRDVIKRGTGRRAQKLGRNDLAGKTGTTNGPTDAWFSGFNAHLVTTTWVGFDNNKKLGRGEYGGVAALPIWIKFMDTALEGIPEALPPQPDGILTVRINPETGERAAPSDPDAIFELFLEENAPTQLVLDNSNTSGGGNAPAPEELF